MSEDKQKVKVLVVDDEDIVVSLICDALEDEQIPVCSASNGPDALRIIKSENIDLLITDIRMSPMDGIVLSRNAREINSNINVIFMTGYANLNTAKDAIRYGAIDYILKPFELSEIRQSVRKAIEKITDSAARMEQASKLDMLSDLSQILYEVGDRKSLVTVSLKFTMMQTEADDGMVLYWNSDRSEFGVVTVYKGESKENTIDSIKLKDHMSGIDLARFQKPELLSKLSDHPLSLLRDDELVGSILFPDWFKSDNSKILTIPISRTDNIFGLITLSVPEGIAESVKVDFKLLSITASQLALSLENLNLLEETQIAYSRLKELQDETIQLEKLATRGEISAEIGHELNNFLGVVAGNLSLLDLHLQRKDYSKLDKYVRGMNDNIEKIKTFTSNLMDLRPTSTALEIISFDRLIVEVVEYLKPQKRFDGVDITLNVEERTIPFLADSTHIQQLLYNLFNNAADASVGCQQREIAIEVTVDETEQTFTVSIKDNGVGIERELLEKAFKDKFTTKPSGHGFGLMVCKRIIDGHSGLLDIESSPGQGTRISIKFQLARTASEVETELSRHEIGSPS